MQKIITLVILLGFIFPLIPLRAEEVNSKKIQQIEKETYKKLMNLEFANQVLMISQGDLYQKTAERLSPGFKSGIIRPFGYDIFKNCKGNCLEKFKKSIENKDISVFTAEESFIQDIYTDPSYQKALGHLIYTKPLTLILNNELYIMPKKNLLYRDYFRLSGQGEFNYYLPPVVPLDDEGSAMWLPWIKKIGYLKPGSYLTSERFEGIFAQKNSECFRDDYRRGFTRVPNLYDLNGKAVEKEKIKDLLVSGYQVRDDDILFYLIDNSKKKSNLVDGVRISPHYLITYPYRRNIVKYTMKKEDLIDDNGNFAIFQIFEVERSYEVICPVEYPPEILSKLKSGKLKFRELGKEYRTRDIINNINFDCNGNDARPACADKTLDAFTPQ